MLTAATAEASWAHDRLAGPADTGVTLPDGPELFIGRITFATDGPAFTLPPEVGNPPGFAALAAEYAMMQRCSLALLLASRQIADRRSNYTSIRICTQCRIRAR